MKNMFRSLLPKAEHDLFHMQDTRHRFSLVPL